MNERCWTLLGSRDAASGTWHVRLQRSTLGGRARVDADWAWTLAREESHGDVMGFCHTHLPGAGTDPSPRDVRTMQAWCSALGKPLLCLIAEEQAVEQPHGFVFADDERAGVRVGSLTAGQDGELTAVEA